MGMQAVNAKDQELVEMINILMHILQSSSSSPDGGGGSSNSPLYGVGFGSSTIMILMGLTIFYLKRQLSQLQVVNDSPFKNY